MFDWFIDPANESLVRALSQVAAATLASAAALAVAFLAYPAQKQKDRQLEEFLETRRVFVAYLRHVSTVQMMTNASEEKFNDAMAEMAGNLNALALYAPPKVLNATKAAALAEYRSIVAARSNNGDPDRGLRNAKNACESEMIHQMRQHLFTKNVASKSEIMSFIEMNSSS